MHLRVHCLCTFYLGILNEWILSAQMTIEVMLGIDKLHVTGYVSLLRILSL